MLKDKPMNRDELQSKICDLITDATIDPSSEDIIKTTKEIMNLIDEYEHKEVLVKSDGERNM